MEQKYIQLNDGVKIPQIGLGVWQAKDGEEVERAVTTAIDAGYRLIDTAAIYGNETGVGKAIKKSQISREELFVTSKVWNADQGYDSTLKAFEKSLERLELSYLDLYLIHWPVPALNKYTETWRALETLVEDGRVKSIGVSNFTEDFLQTLLGSAKILPSVNQVEVHPYLSQIPLRRYCAELGIAVESYSPLTGTGGTLLTEPTLIEIGRKYAKTPAQVVLRWHIQNNLIVIPKSVTPNRIRENIAIFDFSLNDEDMNHINAINTNTRVGADPEVANFM